MSVRELYVGREAAYGVLAATRFALLVEEARVPSESGRERMIPRETTGTRVTAYKSLRLTNQSPVTMRQYGYYDLLGWPLCAFFGAPTTTPVGGATGAFDNLFKGGNSVIASNSLQAKLQTNTGSQWLQMLGVKWNTLGLRANGTEVPMFDFAGFGKPYTAIAAPTPIPLAPANYVQPADLPQQALTYNSIANNTIFNFSLTLNNNMVPRFAINQAGALTRISLGDFIAEFDGAEFLDAYTGSLVEVHETGSGVLSNIVITWTDTATSIGTGTPTNPKITLSIPKPLTLDAGIDPTDNDAEGTIGGELGYDSGLASNISLTLRNELNGYTAS